MRQTQRIDGAGLIEVLVALVIIAVGLLGLLALESHANQAEMESYQRAQALTLLSGMVNRIKANPAFAGCYAQASTQYGYLGVGSSFSSTGCNTTADSDLTAWNDLLNGAAETTGSGTTTTGVGAMIGARGCISIVNATLNEYQVEVAWQGLSPTYSPSSGSGSKEQCGTGLYKDSSGNVDDAVRRDVSFTFVP